MDKKLFDYGLQETKLIDKINDYKDEYEYIDIIKEHFISIAANLISNKTDLNFNETHYLVENNINSDFVKTIISQANSKNYDMNKILKSLNYNDKKETKDTVKNGYTSYYDNYDK